MKFSRTLARWFPLPRTLAPHAAGIDISDTSIKWLSFATGTIVRPTTFGNHNIGAGIVQTGVIRDPKALADALKEVRKKTHLKYAHAALPEEGAYVFSMHVPAHSPRKQIISMIEFELENRVPIPVADTVYDFDTINVLDEHGEEISVTAYPREIADGYIEAFDRAGIGLLSLEIEARSIARAVCASGDPITMLVDSGRARTGVAILKRGIPIFTSTVEIGGDHITHALMEAQKITSEAEAEKFKNEHGLIDTDPEHIKGRDAIEKVAVVIADEIARHYRFFDTRRNEGGGPSPQLERIFLMGGSANLHGLAEYIAGKVHVRTERPNVWRNVASFDDYIPQIEYRQSFQYATAIGLALRSL